MAGFGSTLSSAVGLVQVTTAVERPGSVCRVMSFGQAEISGASLSVMKNNADDEIGENTHKTIQLNNEQNTKENNVYES